MLNALIINKLLQGVVLELGAIVGPNLLDLGFIHTLSFLGEGDELCHIPLFKPCIFLV
jgi:hypothetical protein